LAALLVTLNASAQLFVDHFGYVNGTLGAAGVGDTLWTGGDSPNTPITVNSNAALIYGGLSGSTGSGVVLTGSTFKKKAAPFAPQSGNGVALYCSFLLNISSAPTGTKAFVYLHNSSSGTSSPGLGIFLDSNSRIGLGKGASSPTATTAAALSAGTHFIVARYTFQAGNDQVDLWLDPTSLGGATVPAATLTTGTGSSSDASTLSYLFLNQAVVETLWVDEVRVGNTWAEVTPTSGAPAPPAVAPYITKAWMTSVGIALAGTNGPANVGYDVLASGDAKLPLSAWNEIASDTFDGNGNFSSTNPLLSGATRQFYRVRVAGAPPPQSPHITQDPQSRTNLAGDTATFTVFADGTLPLSYRWYFNTNTLIIGASSSTLTLNNVQTADEGSYFAIVTNIAGSATSAVATLTVSNILAAPGIKTQPQDQTVTEGQTVNFTVVATGTTPLIYQWFFNTNTLLTDRTNANLVLNAVSTNNAGGYSVLVTNALGFTNSAVAFLTVNPPSTNTPDFSQVGFANASYNVTGGAGGPEVTVTTGEQLNQYTDSNGPYIIYVSGTLQISGMSTHIRPNKTVIGLGTNAVLEGGGLYLYRSTNVIIRNLTIRNSTEDDIGLHYSARVWIDHCTIVDAEDGGIDLTQGTDYTTISWCKFIYTVNHGHDFVNLLGASDGESDSDGKLHVTFHHNWWSTNCIERMPSVRFGRAHVYNNYYNAPGNGYCVRSRLNSQCLIENNFFENVKNPWEVYITSGTPGLIYASGNAFTNVTWTSNYPATDPVFTPPYSYSLNPAASVPAMIIEHAGAGRGPFAP
jgi:pectate lyase